MSLSQRSRTRIALVLHPYYTQHGKIKKPDSDVFDRFWAHFQDPSQQALMGQMPSGMYYGANYGGSMAAPPPAATGSPGMSHMGQASSAYPSSPGPGVSYGMQSGQQVRWFSHSVLFFSISEAICVPLGVVTADSCKNI